MAAANLSPGLETGKHSARRECRTSSQNLRFWLLQGQINGANSSALPTSRHPLPVRDPVPVPGHVQAHVCFHSGSNAKYPSPHVRLSLFFSPDLHLPPPCSPLCFTPSPSPLSAPPPTSLPRCSPKKNTTERWAPPRTQNLTTRV